ncbi:MAG TPA: carboxypeptidase-like regulatory domain-containing protein, partial [Terriglobia bacterium]|nr:carboxypeptidase-like regulatory domain-containing protein [Terriglobia bacterium]
MRSHDVFVRPRVILLGLLGITLMNSSMLFGQVAGSGVIQGTVLDPTGAVIPGATVAATETGTGVTLRGTTTDAGFYVLSPLAAGEYTVSVTSKGFKTTVQEHVIVNALSVVGINLTLAVGSTTQQVTVTSAPAALETENGTLGVTIPNDAYTSLPLEVSGGPKSPEGFIYLLPGVANGTGFVGNVNGGEGFSKEIYINGLPLTTAELQGDFRNVTNQVSVETVEQFQVLTSGAPAYYDGQGTENYVFKSGTNKFHGDGYEFVRNNIFDSRGFFSASVPPEKQNEFGGTFGGPIKKDKIFFFGNYDGFRYHYFATPAYYSLPTAQEQQGNFSALPTTIYDPTTQTCNTSGICTRTAYTGNIIPMTEMSPISLKAQSAGLPTPINTNLLNNFLASGVGQTKQNDVTVKGDINLSTKARMFLVYQWGVSGNPNSTPGAVLPEPYTDGRYGETATRNNQINIAYTIRGNLVNVFAASGLTFYTPFTDPTETQGWTAKLGLTGLPPGQAAGAFPPIVFNGPNSPSQWHEHLTDYTFIENNHTFTYQDNLQWLIGKHNVTIGAQFSFQQENVQAPAYGGTDNGFNFSNLETGNILPSGAIDPSTGNSFASFLLGEVDSAGLVQDAAGEQGARYRNYSFYVQDDFKVSPKLTLNLGVRYEIPKPWTDPYNRDSFLNSTVPNPAVDGYPGALEFFGYGSDSCMCRTIVQTHYKDFAPRIGFAYQIGSKNVIRGAYGIYYYNTAALGGNATSTGISTGTPGADQSPLGFSSVPTFSSLNGGVTPAFNWATGFPAYTHAPIFDPTLAAGFNTTTAQGGPIGFGDALLGARAPYTQDWSITYERELATSTVIKVSYSASNSHFLPTAVGRGIYTDQIQPQYEALGPLLTSPATAANIAAAQAMFPGIGLPYANFAGSIGQMLLPFPQYEYIVDNYNDNGNGHYNSLQVAVQRRFSRGFQFLISYTLSREIDDAGSNLGGFTGSSGRTAYNNRLEKAVGLQDIPNQLAI